MNEQLSTTNSLIDAAIASRLADDPLTAEQQLHTALNEARRHCNEILEARALIELARLMIFDSPQPDPHNTRRWLDRALEIYIKFGFDNGRAYALVMLGDLFLMLGQPDKAISSIYEAKDLFERESNQSGVAMTWHEIGRVAVITKDYGAAEKPLCEAIRIHEESGDNLSIGRNLLGLGLVYLKHHHNIPQARECYSRALRLFELAGSISDANQARHNLQTLDVEEAVDPSANF